jgi:hypothetical protein
MFQVAGRSGTTLTPSLTLYVSVASLDFDREKLIALGCKLGRDHRRDNQLWVWIFDSYRAAKWRSTPRKGSNPEADRARIAIYSFGRATDDYGQYLRLPDPARPNEYIRIDLGGPPTK